MKLKTLLFLGPVFIYTNLFAQNAPLEWAKGAVWYQILPERFSNGSTENDPVLERILGDVPFPWQGHPWTADWYRLLPWEIERGQTFYQSVNDRRFGGDLLGVIEKLPYLKNLGVDVIYFNPIFEAPSADKYDATTFHHVDNNFGYDRDGDWVAIQFQKEDPESWTWSQADLVFLELVQKAHEMGLRIVIDAVFNHCGDSFWAFQHVRTNQQNSPYQDWFEITAWDDPATPDTSEFDYRCWLELKNLPVFRKDENGLVEPVKKYIFNITRRWMDPNADGDPSDGIDGWRLSVPLEIDATFWEQWNALIKSLNPDAIAVGELWEDAPDWTSPKRFDTLTNYPFAKTVADFFVHDKKRISVSEFDNRLKGLRNAYPDETNVLLMNVVDSHDTDRISSMIKNPDRRYGREAGIAEKPDYDPRRPNRNEKKVQKLIALFQMTYLGAPLITYGDEAGMWGGTYPDNSKPMLWPDSLYEKETYRSVQPKVKAQDENVFDKDMFSFYKKLIEIRRAQPALRVGSFITRLIDNKRDLYGFSRKYTDSEMIILLNNGESKRLLNFATLWKDGTIVKDLLNENTYQVREGMLKMALDNKGGVILMKERPTTNEMAAPLDVVGKEL
ncbi:MAG: glycoside hydrolase family 13 protein [bacterium]